MNRNVRITITSEQEMEQDGEIRIEGIPGIRRDENGTIYLHFQEKVEGIEDEIRTLIKINGGIVHVTRSGGLKTNMDFIIDTPTHSLYQTPVGTLDFEIETDGLNILDENDTLSIKLHYTMTAAGEVMAVNRFTLTAVAI